MTAAQSTTSGLRFISRPSSSFIERTGFFVIRHWRWTGVVVASLFTACLLIASIALATGLDAEKPVRAGYIGFLFTIPLVTFFVFHVSGTELRTAPVWMFRAALASASDDERAFLFERLLQLAMSEWRDDPVSCGVLFDLFKEAKLAFGKRIKRRREARSIEREEQINALRKLASDGASPS